MTQRFTALRAIALSAVAFLFTLSLQAAPPPAGDGVVRIRSAHGFSATVERLRKDVAAKGIREFQVIDQAALAAAAGVSIRPSTLIVFGNAPLGTQFLRANPGAGLDWPVRLLVTEDDDGAVWASYTDFQYIARRHRIAASDLDPFRTASGVIASITASVAR